jgi:hypothetical protein
MLHTATHTNLSYVTAHIGNLDPVYAYATVSNENIQFSIDWRVDEPSQVGSSKDRSLGKHGGCVIN